ncbi:MAG: signal peptidase II [Bryobacterales bacterium]|nr:signal peptidase II [Bryobacteraceae bacterium]MDW8354392.1 signal peptidase II [Bryobacterales bacterium]
MREVSPRLAALVFAAGVFSLDLATKTLIRARVGFWDTYVVIPGFFNIVRVENRGIAFGLLSNGGGEWRTLALIAVSAAVLAFVASLLWQPHRHGSLVRAALALVLGGAAGNLYDRVVHGAVTDFIDLHVGRYHWPAFNVADSAITLGAALLLADLWRGRRKETSS